MGNSLGVANPLATEAERRRAARDLFDTQRWFDLNMQIGPTLLSRRMVGTARRGRGTARREPSASDVAECGPSRGVVKKAQNEANENRWLTF
jgi:hypothetical protein